MHMRTINMAKEVADIRITDPFTKQLIAAQQELRGDKTPTKTAMGLIRERISQLELMKTIGSEKTRRRERQTA